MGCPYSATHHQHHVGDPKKVALTSSATGPDDTTVTIATRFKPRPPTFHSIVAKLVVPLSATWLRVSPICIPRPASARCRGFSCAAASNASYPGGTECRPPVPATSRVHLGRSSVRLSRKRKKPNPSPRLCASARNPPAKNVGSFSFTRLSLISAWPKIIVGIVPRI